MICGTSKLSVVARETEARTTMRLTSATSQAVAANPSPMAAPRARAPCSSTGRSCSSRRHTVAATINGARNSAAKSHAGAAPAADPAGNPKWVRLV